MTDLKIKVRDGVHLSSFRLADKPALLEHLSSKEIYDTTLTIPHPYVESHADSLLQKRIEHAGRQAKETSRLSLAGLNVESGNQAPEIASQEGGQARRNGVEQSAPPLLA